MSRMKTKKKKIRNFNEKKKKKCLKNLIIMAVLYQYL